MNTHNMLIVCNTDMYVQDSDGQILLETKPALSFEYKEIRYYIGEQLYSINGTDFIGLSTEQQSEIEQFISSKRAEVGILKLAVDSDGKYLGRIKESDPKVAAIVDMSPPNGDSHWYWSFDTKKWMIKYFYDDGGSLVQESSDKKVGFTFVPHPNKLFYKFDTESQTWQIKITPDDLDQYKKYNIQIILKQYFSSLLFDNDISLVLTKLNEIDLDSPYKRIVSSVIPSINYAEDVQTIDNMVCLAMDSLTNLPS